MQNLSCRNVLNVKFPKIVAVKFAFYRKEAEKVESLPQNEAQGSESHSVAMLAVPLVTLTRILAGGAQRHWFRGYAAEGAAGGVVGNQRAFRGCWFPLAGHRALSGRGSWKPTDSIGPGEGEMLNQVQYDGRSDEV